MVTIPGREIRRPTESFYGFVVLFYDRIGSLSRFLEKNFASICTETVGIGKLIIRNYDQETARLLLILSKNGVQVKNMQNVTETLEEYYSKLI